MKPIEITLRGLPPTEAETDEAWSDARWIAHEHARLDQLLSDVEWRVGQRLYADAHAHFSEFRRILTERMREEEHTLFPRWERSLGESGQAITGRLRHEHEVMRRMVEQIARTLQGGDLHVHEVTTTISDLRELLAPHRDRELKLLGARSRSASPASPARP